MLKSLKALTVVLAMSGFAHADSDGTGDGGQYIPVGFDANEAQGAPMSCSEGRATAWFVRELSRSDGDAQPEVAYSPCGRELLAESSADSD